MNMAKMIHSVIDVSLIKEAKVYYHDIKLILQKDYSSDQFNSFFSALDFEADHDFSAGLIRTNDRLYRYMQGEWNKV